MTKTGQKNSRGRLGGGEKKKPDLTVRNEKAGVGKEKGSENSAGTSHQSGVKPVELEKAKGKKRGPAKGNFFKTQRNKKAMIGFRGEEGGAKEGREK